MAAVNEVMEVGWIACRESSICNDFDFEGDGWAKLARMYSCTS